ncbi:uncharacterized protein LOC120183068 [Hibiscus syriacus]|uniref:uncharacterized protein LOC120183068 n=1 Tax=Hibiscus syriacus TaxID=106335 RepID=UPI001923127A|nr:uncharacterized protein LOC120183068 [Hibiscus syriacus]
MSAGAISVRSVRDAIRVKRPLVIWQKIIWFPLHISKHSLISWMALLDRLPTKDRLLRMVINDCQCMFCDDPLETRDHLFLHCPMADYLWNSIFSLCGLQFRTRSWESFLAWACSSCKDKSLLTSIMKIALNALIYIIWEERNKKMFLGRSRNAQELLRAIKDIVGSQLRGRNLNSINSVNTNLCKHWDIV